MGNKLISGTTRLGKMIRCFKVSDFDEKLAQGFVKLVEIDGDLRVKVIDTYNRETEEEREEYFQQGYIKVGY